MAPSITRTPSTERVTAAPIASLIAAAGFAIEGVMVLVHPTGDDHWDVASQILNLSFALGCLALIFALPALGRYLAVGRVGRIGIVMAQVGFAAMVLESVVSSIHDGNTLGGVFLGGLILTLLGQLTFAIAGLRSGRQKWAAPLPLLGMFVAIAGGDHGGSIILAAIWLILAVILGSSSLIAESGARSAKS